MRKIKYYRIFILLVGLFYTAGIYAQVKKNPVIIEIAGEQNTDLNAQPLKPVCKAYHIPVSAVYQWRNHLAVYGDLDHPEKLKQQVEQLFPASTVKVYQHPYYNFNRDEHCGDGKSAREWDNILLTANLVDNKKLQAQYLAYHATQFKKWPEVARGFCNADFQQLLGFKNGRQLLLVISIPKGMSLDKLNPKTTENNPKVVEWNNLMKRYQEGLPGTKTGEVWVFLKPLKNI